MTIANFPAALVPAIQTGFLEREFREGLQSKIVYRSVANRENFPANVGETITKTRKGLKAPITTASSPSGNTNLDNGMSPTSWTLEQYILGINMYNDTQDLNMVTQRVGIEDTFLHNARTNGIQAAQSIDRLARQALLDAYMSGNTRVRVTNSGSQTYCDVDDVRGFLQVPVNGVMTTLNGSTATMSVTINGTSYTVNTASVDGSNTSSVAALGGKSGRLTLSSSAPQSDCTINNTVVAQYAPTILRPNGRASTYQLLGTDLFSMSIVLDAVTRLRNNAVDPVDGLYNCYLDPTSARQLFADPDFKQLYTGVGAATEFTKARVIELLDVRFLPTTEAAQQTLTAVGGSVNVHRPLVVGEGALVEGVFDGTGYSNLGNANGAMVDVVDGVAMITRPPLDRLQQIIAQSWYYIGGFVCPTDVTATSSIIPTASSALFKRGVLIEHA